MRIAFLHHTYPGVGGTETVTHLLAGFFNRKGIECDIISWQRGTSGCKPDYIENIFYLPDNSSLNTQENNDFILSLVKDKSIDIIINQGPFWNIDKRVKSLGCTLISVLHYSPTFKIDNNLNSIIQKFAAQNHGPVYFAKTFIRYIFRHYFAKNDFVKNERNALIDTVNNSDRFIVLCEKYIPQLKKILDIEADNIIAIKNPIAIPEPLNLPANTERKGLMYLGRLSHWDKHVERLIKIWGSIYKKHPDWTLYIVGDGEDRQKLENYVQNLHIERVIFTGFCNPKSYFNKSSVLCMTSSSEGYPMVILEAALNNMPTIAYNVSSGIESLIEDNRSGYLINPFDEDMYKAKLSELITNPDKLETMGKNAYKRALENDIAKIGPMWIELFNKLSAEQ